MPMRSEEAQRVINETRFEGQTASDGFLWDFETTPAISSYIYCVCAGNYKMIKNMAPNASTPMRIFARESKFAYCNHEEVFRIVQEGIDFYKELFGYKFPFAKYDVIYCPEFRIGAMENVGAVTFTDRVLKPLDE